MALVYDPSDPATIADPHPVYDRLREEDPVHWSPALKGWVLTRYDDVKAVALDRGELTADRLLPFYRSLPDQRQARLAEAMRYLSLWMVFRDPPEHTRLRALLARSFTPGAVAALEPRVEAIVSRLLDGLEGRAEIDLMADFAVPLPALVIMALLGVPDDRLADMKRWSDDMALFVGSARVEGEKYAQAEAGARAMATYFRALAEARRARPEGDLMSALIAAQSGRDALNDDEVVASAMLLLFAGHETTANLIGAGTAYLLRNPEQAELLRDDPDVADDAVEELLRYESPSNALARIVARAHRLRGCELQPGQRLFALQTAANHDPRVFRDPHRLDLRRRPNRHVAFGHGIHFCLGAPLARLEGRIALPALLRRFPKLRLLRRDLHWNDSFVLRGLLSLPLATGA